MHMPNIPNTFSITPKHGLTDTYIYKGDTTFCIPCHPRIENKHIYLRALLNAKGPITHQKPTTNPNGMLT